MIIDIGDGGGSSVRIQKNGVPIGEIVVGQVLDAAALWGEVQRARRLENLAGIVRRLRDEITRERYYEDHANPTPEKRQLAWWRGLKDGLARKTATHPMPGVPPIRPEGSVSYSDGYDTGEVIARLLAAVDETREKLTPEAMRPGV